MLSILLNPVTLVSVFLSALPCASISSRAEKCIGSGNVSFERGRPEEDIFAIRCQLYGHSSRSNYQTKILCDSKATDPDVVGNETENNSANPQTLVLENRHINPPEEPELMANTDYDALKKPVCVFIPNLCLKQHNARKKKEKSEK
ncbi:hypothetical protein TNCV_2730531 [Trichonephila clavipes]|nr:hypothetical protein TNCV_2730531 [Trichonephila clavipes]